MVQFKPLRLIFGFGHQLWENSQHKESESVGRFDSAIKEEGKGKKKNEP